MKKKQDKSVHAAALQIAIALALVSLSVVLIASSFAQRSAAPAQNVSAYAFQGSNAYAGVPDGSLPVVVTATGGNTAPTSYLTLQAGFAEITPGLHQGALNVATVVDTSESHSAVLNDS